MRAKTFQTLAANIFILGLTVYNKHLALFIALTRFPEQDSSNELLRKDGAIIRFIKIGGAKLAPPKF